MPTNISVTTPNSTDSTTTCDRCGNDRPADPRRLTLTVSDLTDSTAALERGRLCWECWEDAREKFRGWLA